MFIVYFNIIVNLVFDDQTVTILAPPINKYGMFRLVRVAHAQTLSLVTDTQG